MRSVQVWTRSGMPKKPTKSHSRSEAKPEQAIARPEVVNARGAPEPRVRSETVTSISFEAFSGPYPHPQELAQYEHICPGFSDRMLQATEKEVLYRRDLSLRTIEAEIQDRAAERSERCGIRGK